MSRTQEEPGEVAEASVYRRYAAAANQREAALCCPVEYAADFLSVIPDEVIERDYGCGDPTPYVKLGDTVLDLGSGGGKLCFIAAQVVGAEGRVMALIAIVKCWRLPENTRRLLQSESGMLTSNLGMA